MTPEQQAWCERMKAKYPVRTNLQYSPSDPDAKRRTPAEVMMLKNEVKLLRAQGKSIFQIANILRLDYKIARNYAR